MFGWAVNVLWERVCVIDALSGQIPQPVFLLQN